MAFGDLNATLAKTIAMNAPKGFTRMVEPFGDGGTMAVYLAKRKPKDHLLNLVDESLFALFEFIQRATSGDLNSLKKMVWVGSPEGFDAALAITDSEGLLAFYRYLYLKNFGTKAAEADAPPIFDVLQVGVDVSRKLNELAQVRVGLKKVTLTNDDPLAVMNQAGGGFLVLLPQTPEDTEAVRARLAGISSPYFFAGKLKDSLAAVEAANQLPNQNVTAMSVASIMMATFGVVWNYDSRLPPLSDDVIAAAGAY